MSIALPSLVVPAIVVPTAYVVASVQSSVYQCSGSLSSQRIIETSSYRTTPSHTPPVLGHRAAKLALRADDDAAHRSGPTVEAILQANQALEAYLRKEVQAQEQALSRASGNYARALATQALERSREGRELPDVVRRGRSRERASEREMCCWSYEDLKRKRHLEMMSDGVTFVNRAYGLSFGALHDSPGGGGRGMVIGADDNDTVSITNTTR
ncbi:hypothetical protein MMC11_001230 [Xylographa trunciseda]|nr:hypothetical protein [Xylographa trunciseda]